MQGQDGADPILTIEGDAAPLDPAAHGLKAGAIQQLLGYGVRVPKAVVVPVSVAEEVTSGVETSVVTRGFAALADAVDRLRPGAPGTDTRFAVRSSATFALPRAFETILDVEPEGVPEAVARVIVSTRSLHVETVVRAMGATEVPRVAVIVQRQVDATADERSGAGVATSRHPVTGGPGLRGAIAWRCRGDAVTAGSVAVDPISTVAARCPDVAAQLQADAQRLEHEIGSPVELEFAIERGELWYLQLRSLAPAVEVAEHRGTVVEGRGVSPGLAAGELHVDPDDALDAIASGRQVIIALETTSPGDVPALVGAAGVMTVLGSAEGHTAVVARGAQVPAVVSVQGLSIAAAGVEVAGRRISVGETVTVDGTRGEIVLPDD